MAGEDIIIKAGFDGTKAEKGLDKLRNNSKEFSNDLTKRFAGLFTATALFDRGLGYITKTFQEIAAYSNQAKRAGLSVEDFQRVSNAAKLSDVSIMAVSKAMREIRKTTSEAAAGNEKQRKSLEDLGFTSQEINSGNIEATEVLIRLARAYGLAKNEAQKFGVATSVLSDKTGAELIPLLESGPEDLSRAMGRRVVSQAQADAADQASDNLDTAGQDLTIAAGGILGDIMELAGAISHSSNDLTLRSMTMDGKESDEAVQYFESDAFQNAIKYMTAGGDLGAYPQLKEQMFAEYFPQRHAAKVKADQEARMAAETKAAQAPKDTAGTPTSPANLAGVPASVSGLQSMGGGGYYYDGAALMVDTATRTANATESIADTLREMKDRGSVITPPATVSDK